MNDETKILNLIQKYNIPIVKQYSGTVRNMQHLSDSIKEMSGIEGFVIRFDNGTWAKIKCDEYCMYHKAKEDINFEKNIVSILVNNQADDFKPLLSKEDRALFDKFEADFWVGFHEFYEIVYDVILNVHASNISRKNYALYAREGDQYIRACVFQFFDEKNVSETNIKDALLKTIKKNCGSQTNIDRVRSLWGNLDWNQYRYNTFI